MHKRLPSLLLLAACAACFAAAPVPALAPQYVKLKKLYLETPLKKAVIVAGNTPEAREIAQAAARRWRIPVVENEPWPLKHHVIAIGARENNPFIDTLYRRGFCLTDAVYPGKGGHELRSIHNPSGGGFNCILAGGSTPDGIRAAGKKLLALPDTPGFLMDTAAPGFRPDAEPGDNFGWNRISLAMARFYQTGDTKYAKEFLRLAFPKSKADQITEDESIQTREAPLSGPYHYYGHRMIQFWDLIEEHPFFTDAQRLAVTNAFARQIDHPGVGRGDRYDPQAKNLHAPSRHGQWALICRWLVARYFQRDYPDPVWNDIVKSSEARMRALNDPEGYVEGERGVLVWTVNGAINPGTEYMFFNDIRNVDPDGGWANAVRYWEALWNGTRSSPLLATALPSTMRRAAALTGDGKFLYYEQFLAPKDESGPGPSYAVSGIAPRRPDELLDRWTVARLKQGARDFYKFQIPPGAGFLSAGWRDAWGGEGDFIAFAGINEYYRTPFKLMSLYELRIDGETLLCGLGNFVQTSIGGATEAHIPTAAQLIHTGNTGNAVFFSGKVPDHAFAEWRRDMLLAKRGFALFADTVTAREKRALPLDFLLNLENPIGFLENKNGTLRISADRRVLLRSYRTTASEGVKVTVNINLAIGHAHKSGDRLTHHFTLDRPFKGALAVAAMPSKTGAETIHIGLDGRILKRDVPHRITPDDPAGVSRIVPLGEMELAAGEHTIFLEIAKPGPDPAPTMSAKWLTFYPKEARRYAVSTGGARMFAQPAGGGAAMRALPCDPARPTTVFTLVRADAAPVECLGDRAAKLRVPEPAVAFTGRRGGFGDGALVLVSGKRIYATQTTVLDGLFAAQVPVDLAWEAGKLQISGPAGAAVTVLGKTHRVGRDGKLEVAADAPWAELAGKVAAQTPAPGGTARTAAPKPSGAPKTEELIRTERPITFFLPVEWNGRRQYLVASGKTLDVCDAAGRREWTTALSGSVMSAAVWPEADGLAVGDRNDFVTLFGADGQVRWRFRSEIAQRQASYWSKQTYPGVYSLTPYKRKLYVGSTCTMEIVDLQGKLVARHPNPWGPVRSITVLPRTDGKAYLIGLRHSKSPHARMFCADSETDDCKMGFVGNMPGYQDFPYFFSMYRTKAFAGDFDGDGKPELLTDGQGMYLWLQLYDENGKPKKQLNFGPGDKNQLPAFVDWDAGDFTGDARPEAVLVNHLTRRLTAVDGRCEILWSAPVPFLPKHLALDPKKKLIAVSGRREIAVFDGEGKLRHFFSGGPVVENVFAVDGHFLLQAKDKLLRLKLPEAK